MKVKFPEGTRSGINCFVTVRYGVDHDAVSVSMINMNNDGTVAGINSCSLEDQNIVILSGEPVPRANLATNEVFANSAYVHSTAPGCGVAPVAKLANDPSDQGGVVIVNFANTMSICRYK